MIHQSNHDPTTWSLQADSAKKPTQSPILIMTLLTHPKIAMIGARAVKRFTRGGSISLSRNAPEFVIPGHQLGEPLGDPAISRKPLIFQTVANHELRLIRGKNPTAVLVDGSPVGAAHSLNAEQLKIGVCLTLSERILVLLQSRMAPLQPWLGSDMGMIGNGEGLAQIRAEIEKIAPLNIPILIRGETGSGKELVARALHRYSNRSNKPFIDVNLGALPQTLAAAEIFGVRRGAYTGAGENKPGYFRAAHGGVLFLDEIGEAPLAVQTMLLRLLETGQVAPIGTHECYTVNVRLISATDADLESRIASGSFKEPLLHRLSAYEINIPPLRHRLEDFGSLFLHFARETLEELGIPGFLERRDPFGPPWLPTEMTVRLVRFPWPGNIRQFRNLVRKLIIGNQSHANLDTTPQVERILGKKPVESQVQSSPGPADHIPPSVRRKPAQVTREELKQALRRASWEPKATAGLLNVARSSIYDLMRKFPDIKTTADLTPEEVTESFQHYQGNVAAMSETFEVSKPALMRRLRAMGLLN